MPTKMISKTFKALILILVASSHKTLPLAYVFRFYYQTIVGLFTSRSTYLATKKNSFGYNSPNHLFKWITLKSRVSPLELDMYFHKLNSTYFLDLDIARTKLLTRLLQTFWWSCYDNEAGRSKKPRVIGNFPYVPIATVQCRFIRELKPFQKFDISSRVLAWDKKWLFVMSKFTTQGKGEEVINAIALTKYVFKSGRLTLSPYEYLSTCGFLNEENEKINERNMKLVESLVDVEDLERIAHEMT